MAGGRLPRTRLRAAIAVSERWTTARALVHLDDVMQRSGIGLAVAATFDDALSHLARQPGFQAMLLDTMPEPGIPLERVVSRLKATLDRLKKDAPDVAPVVLVESPPAALVIAAYRAGAADVVDLGGDPIDILAALDHAAGEHIVRREQRERARELKGLVDEFLKVLVKAEKRSLELEVALEGNSGEIDVDARPRVLIVDDESEVVDLLMDVLTRRGLMTYAAYTGEEAVGLVDRMQSTNQPVDMALIDNRLPGMDGLRTIKSIHEVVPGLPCMVMTGFSDPENAVDAANLGVVGYVLKPFEDTRALSQRVEELARSFAAERRQRQFLARIKRKHAEFLERYSKIAADLAKNQ